MEGQVLHLVLLFLIVYSGTVQGNRESYDASVKLINTLVKNASYSPQVRPLYDQSKILTVSLMFLLISIAEVDEVAQRVTVNGVLTLIWFDEILVWNPADYSGVRLIYPNLEDVWKPRIGIFNTLGVREPFQEEKNSVQVTSDGMVLWSPGDLFSVSCIINPTCYPFDEQECSIQFISMGYFVDQLLFKEAEEKFNTRFFVTNSEWELTDFISQGGTVEIFRENLSVPAVNVTLKIRRRPSYPIITIVLPAIFLSYLNTLVFVIPVESGEKVSYGITVLLAQSVYMTEMSNVLPKSSLALPVLSMYVFSLLFISVVNVLISIVVVGLNHLGKEQMPMNEEDVSSASSQTSEVRNDHVTTLNSVKSKSNIERKGVTRQSLRQINWKLVSKVINKVSFVLSTLIWLAGTVVFFLITIYPNVYIP